ncbi:MAG: TolC family protein [Deltaproteobacteria bacterium]|nr:TolC family protein [Deltaproteobacteria bacterium]
MRAGRIALIGALLLAPGAGAETLSIDQAVARALGRHPALAAAGHAEDAARARTRQARTAWLPRVSVEGAYRYQGPVPELSIDTGITLPGTSEPVSITREIGTAHVASASVTAGWRALDFGARAARVEAAAAMERAAAADGAERQAEVAQAVRLAYLGVALQDEVARVTEGALAVARDARDRAQSGLAAGLASKVGVAAARSRVAELESRLVAARQGRERGAETLRLLLGLSPGEPVVLSERLGELVPVEVAAPETTPVEARLDASQQALERQQQAVRRSALPTVDLYATGGYQYPRTFVETDRAGFVWAAGVKLSWEAFDGGLRARQRDELDARIAEVGSLREAAGEDTRRRLADAEAALRTARASGEAATAQVEAARVYLDAARGGQEAGTATTLEVQAAEEALEQAQLAEIKASFDAAVAQAERLRALGVARVRAEESGR